MLGLNLLVNEVRVFEDNQYHALNRIIKFVPLPVSFPRLGVWGRNELRNRPDSWACEFYNLKEEHNISKLACKLSGGVNLGRLHGGGEIDSGAGRPRDRDHQQDVKSPFNVVGFLTPCFRQRLRNKIKATSGKAKYSLLFDS